MVGEWRVARQGCKRTVYGTEYSPYRCIKKDRMQLLEMQVYGIVKEPYTALMYECIWSIKNRMYVFYVGMCGIS
jgi:hypothetical protein